MKILAKVDVFQSLVRETLVKLDGENTWVEFRYERCSNFYYNCGIIGHGDKSCNGGSGDGQNNREGQFGVWLRAGDIMTSPLKAWKRPSKEDVQSQVVATKVKSVAETTVEKQYNQSPNTNDPMMSKGRDKKNKDKDQRMIENEISWMEILRENID